MGDGWFLQRIGAAAAAILWRRSGSRPRADTCGHAAHIGPTRSAIGNLSIQRELACAEIKRAKKAKKKAPFREAFLATNEMLRREAER